MRLSLAAFILYACVINPPFVTKPVLANAVEANSGHSLACVGYVDAEDYCGWSSCYGSPRWETIIPWGTMLVLLLCSSVLIVERGLKFTVATRQTRAFKREVSRALFCNQVEEVLSLASRYIRSPLATVLRGSLPACSLASQTLTPCMHARQRVIIVETIELKRGLWALAAIGWTGPLLGTFILSLGIMNTLNAARAAEGISVFAIEGGIADSMWATIFGVLVAFPTVWASKYFSAKLEAFVLEMDRLSLAIIDQIVNQQQTPFPRTSTADDITQQLQSLETNGLTLTG